MQDEETVGVADTMTALPPQTPPANDPIATEVGREYLMHVTSQQNVADRTGELMATAHHVSSVLRRATIVGIVEPDTGTEAFAVLRPDGKTEALPSTLFDDYRDTPKRRTGIAVMTRVESFIEHVNRFKDARSALFAVDDMENPRLGAVLDYHPSVAINGEDVPPAFAEHRAQYDFPLSRQWLAWNEQNAEKMDLVEFARFLEDRWMDVELIDTNTVLNGDIGKVVSMVGRDKVATPSRLLELSRGLAIHENSSVSEVRNLASGEGEVRFTSEHVDQNGAPVSIPSLFIVLIPVFARDDLYRIIARLRYRKTPQGLRFWFELQALEDVFEDAFARVCDRAREETSLPLFYGNPE